MEGILDPAMASFSHLTTLGRYRSRVLLAGWTFGVFLFWHFLPAHPASLMFLGFSALGLGFAGPAWSLALLALTAPFEQVRIFGGAAIYTTEWLVVLSSLGWAWNLARHPGWRKPAAKVWAWSLPFLLALLVSGLAHPSWISLKGGLRWLEFFGVLLLGSHLLRRGQDAEPVVWALLLSAGFSAAAGLGEFFGAAPGLLAIDWQGQSVTRASAGFGPNTLAVFLAMMLPWCLSAALAGRHGWQRLAGILALGVLAAGVLAAFSLTGLTALAAGVGVWLLLSASPRKVLWLAVAALVVLAWLGWQHPGIVSSGFWETKLASWRDRLDYAAVVAAMLRESPWLGWGPGNYRFVAPGFGSPDVNVLGLITYPHALWLTVLAETGVLGLAALLLFAAGLGRWMLTRTIRIQGQWPAMAAIGMAAGAIGFAVANLTEHCLIHDRGVVAAVYLAAALAMVKRPLRPWPPERTAIFEQAWQEPPGDPASILRERSQGREALYTLLEASLAGKSNPRILELGCGPAWDALQLAGRPGAEVHALDCSAHALRLARTASPETGRPLTLPRADLRRTGLPDAGFDLVFSQGVLEHFPDPEPVWREMARLVKPGGSLVVDVPQTWNPYTVVKWGHQLRGDWPWGWETHYSLGSLKWWGRRNGFSFRQARGYGYRGGVADPTAWCRALFIRVCPAAWRAWERKTGARWMMNVAVRFEKL